MRFVDDEAVKVAIRVRITKQMDWERQQAIDHLRTILDRMGDPVERERRDLEHRTILVGDQLLADSKRRVLPLYPQDQYTRPQTGSLTASEV